MDRDLAREIDEGFNAIARALSGIMARNTQEIGQLRTEVSDLRVEVAGLRAQLDRCVPAMTDSDGR